MPRLISLNGHGEVKAKPDMAVVNVGVTTQAQTAREALTQNTEAMEKIFASLKSAGIEGAETMSDEDIQGLAAERARSFLENAPTTAAQAARIILDGVKAGTWRILVGEDAHKLDQRVRQAPEDAYAPEFYKSFAEEVGWRLG